MPGDVLSWPGKPDYRPVFPDESDAQSLRRLIPCYRDMLLATVDLMRARFARNGDYPYIDTKIDLFAGRDASRMAGNIDLYGRDTVYAWIQSRGVEALCGHADWIARLPDLSDTAKSDYRRDICAMVERVIGRLERARELNGGSLFFWMDVQGRPFVLDEQGVKHPPPCRAQACFASDMFHVKALAAAGVLLDRPAMLSEARRYFARWLDDVRAGRVQPDQQPFDPKNCVVPPPGRRSHSHRMITLGALALYAGIFDDPLYIATGLEFIGYIFGQHVNLERRFPGLAHYDFVEFIDDRGRPYPRAEDALCDPGHALEFVGLALKFLNVIRARSVLAPDQQALIAEYDRLLPDVLRHAFDLGFNAAGGGIYKLVSLQTRRPVNSDMPWWNLPETMRAAMLCHDVVADEQDRMACREIVRLASNAFLGKFVERRIFPLAWQTLNALGRPVPVIPATPDLDPGYHTGLSMIDCLRAMPPPAAKEAT